MWSEKWVCVEGSWKQRDEPPTLLRESRFKISDSRKRGGEWSGVEERRREWNDERMKVPTKAGEDLGITMVKKTTRDGRDYYKNLYNKEAQEFLVDHLDAIAGYQEQRKEAKKYGLDVDDIPVTGLKEDEPIPVKEKEIKNEKKEEKKEEKKTPTKKKKSTKKE